MTELALCLIESEDLFHPTAALATHVRRTRRIQPRWRSELVEDHEPRPGAVEIQVVCVGEQRRELRSGRSCADLRHGDAAVCASKPFHVTETRAHAERIQRAKADVANAVVFGNVDV